jgi:DNA-nicking Smr family endonuclease
MSSRDRSRRRVLNQDERVLWSTVTRSIKPMRAGTPAVPAPADDAEAEPAQSALAGRRAALAPPVQAEPVSPPELTPLGRRLRARVARGKEAIDARLDLHGLTQAHAHAALLHFLRSASARDARLVLVITGKGSRSFNGRGDGERGVLKRQVPQWLGLPEFRGFVVGFEDAHIAHGGEGALYVRIRRTRK